MSDDWAKARDVHPDVTIDEAAVRTMRAPNPALRTTKPRSDRRALLHRVNCPKEIWGTYEGAVGPVLGFGFKCGCLGDDQPPPWEYPQTGRSAEVDNADEGVPKAVITRLLVRMLPNWVHVENSVADEVDPDYTYRRRWDAQRRIKDHGEELEREVQGALVDSFQTWTDVPLYQWHRYYDWNFWVQPDEGYWYLTSMAQLHGHPPGTPPRRGVIPPMECEWDLGAFARPGVEVTSDGEVTRVAGVCTPFPGATICWPARGQHVWLAGRWVFDCGHGKPTELPGETQEALDARRELLAGSRDRRRQQMRSELHPIKAVAWAQSEGVLFAEENSGRYVPGVKFMFVASRLGGYYDFPTLNTKDYEFVVDLPWAEALEGMRALDPAPHPRHPGSVKIAGSNVLQFAAAWLPGGGAGAEALLRTTELLMRVETQPFELVMQGRQASGVVPRVTPVARADGALPRQVKITIPLRDTGDDADYYAVVVSLGWRDGPGLALSREVHRVVVTFDAVTKGDVDEDVGAEEWSVRYSANGRWFQKSQNSVHRGSTIPLGETRVELYLAAGDELTVCAHGVEHDLVEELFDRPDAARTVTVAGSPIAFERDVVRGDGRTLQHVADAVFDLSWSSLKDTGDALGRVHDAHPVAELAASPGVPRWFSAQANALEEDDRLAETREIVRGDSESLKALEDELRAARDGAQEDPAVLAWLLTLDHVLLDGLIQSKKVLDYRLTYHVTTEPQADAP